ncbi:MULTISPECIES: DEAD/DEAH box helicase [Hymenobacter]|uniref:DEAD/DEAH box helicase n=1 Tax=Hymenobacter jejuensis TaxID=2502781 RepID=A0A5B8A616_9BACT|nr:MULTISPECIES: DEAD/DEAH box helicase [Hymenobacter]MBC6989631.1 DEAD/DEAH box helicase [Hymenobacter sp. BT491]QDA61692.1 DEAD/DEAH box helicase [Hymenobacter jejuensis]
MPSFSDLGLAPYLLQALEELNFTAPTPVQEQVVPLALAGQDVAGQAPTGSGKTAAYGLSILQQLDIKTDAVQVIVLVPARELALQVRDALKKLGKYLPNLRVVAFYGGHAFRDETVALKQPPHVVVATPGRLLDHFERRTIVPNQLKVLILDEADKLLELGFQDELVEIVKRLPRRRQTLLFSATMSDKVLALIRANLTRPRVVSAGEEEGGNLPENLTLLGHVGPIEKKPAALLHLLQKPETGRALIFCNTRERCVELARFLVGRGVAAEVLHGKMPQPERDKALMKLRNGSSQVLVATDVAARGLDVTALDTVVQYESPDKADAFQHRAGRTARAGAVGTAHILTTPKEQEHVQKWPVAETIQWKAMHAPALPPAAPKAPRPTSATLHVSAGRRDKVSAHDLVGTFVAHGGLEREAVGHIEVFDHYSYVAVPREQATDVAQRVTGAKIKGRKIRVSLVE